MKHNAAGTDWRLTISGDSSNLCAEQSRQNSKVCDVPGTLQPRPLRFPLYIVKSHTVITTVFLQGSFHGFMTRYAVSINTHGHSWATSAYVLESCAPAHLILNEWDVIKLCRRGINLNQMCWSCEACSTCRMWLSGSESTDVIELTRWTAEPFLSCTCSLINRCISVVRDRSAKGKVRLYNRGWACPSAKGWCLLS